MVKKKIDIWMPLYISDYMSDTMHLNTEQHGAYLLLLMASWKLGGKLPNNKEQLQAITRLSPEKWNKNESLLKQFFHEEPDFLVQKRISSELKEAENNSKKKSELGKLGAKNRWPNDAPKMPEIMAKHMPQGMATDLKKNGTSPSPNFTTFVNTPSKPPSQEEKLIDSAMESEAISVMPHPRLGQFFQG